MDTHISDHSGVTRKNQICRVCAELLPAGSNCHHYTGVEDGYGFYSLHFHPECWEYARDWDDDDWEILGPGEVSQETVKKWLEQKWQRS